MDWNVKNWNITGNTYTHISGYYIMLKDVKKGWFGKTKLMFEVFTPQGKRIDKIEEILSRETNWFHAYCPYYKIGEIIENYSKKKGIIIDEFK